MPFDPTLPINNTVIDADELRAQFNGLKTLIDAVPAGPAGSAGVAGGDSARDLRPKKLGEAGPTLMLGNID